MSTQYDGDDDELRDWVDLIDRRTNRSSEYYHHPPKPWLREEALKAAYDAYNANSDAALATYRAARDVYYAAFNTEIARIEREYPQ